MSSPRMQTIVRDALVDLDGIDLASLTRDVAKVIYQRVGRVKTEEIIGRLVGAGIDHWDPPGLVDLLDEPKRRLARKIAVPALQHMAIELADGL